MDDINFSLWLNLFFFHCVQTYLLHITLKDSILGKKNNFQAHGRFKVLWGVLCIGNSDKAIRHSNIRSSTPFIIIPV